MLSTSSGNVTTLAGSDTASWIDDEGDNAAFDFPYGIAASPSGGRLYVSDFNNNLIRSIDIQSAMVSTVAGTNAGGYLDDVGVRAQFRNPHGIVVDPASVRFDFDFFFKLLCLHQAKILLSFSRCIFLFSFFVPFSVADLCFCCRCW